LDANAGTFFELPEKLKNSVASAKLKPTQEAETFGF